MSLTIHQIVKPAGARRTQRAFGFAERGAVQCSAPRSGECSGFKAAEIQLARRITRLRTRGLGFAAEKQSAYTHFVFRREGGLGSKRR
jgi:hypothetical protein